ncbi:hypothetical protein CPHO_02580 [Corynebacterium phocae]|uniref:HTH arsR-type domain-containing protein n=1 Tax=Corynebacterium phocae TaxID=161895 RepID=A0A1L7D1J8_9CORY|nr:metalloregulator ArsR/SmtB family transcription factor [Corynebacterium phocae]APT91974.1 hypothetical protein CPHO_02580 [Corynebacterium phocae]KAA8726968.1 winged helix-turn-helix transcriptional regulator [Corynebacterium phocae]
MSQWARTFKTLGCPTRLSLLMAIHQEGSPTVTRLAEQAGVRVATASAALRAMEKMGTVESVRDGRMIHYQLADPRVHQLLHLCSG